MKEFRAGMENLFEARVAIKNELEIFNSIKAKMAHEKISDIYSVVQTDWHDDLVSLSKLYHIDLLSNSYNTFSNTTFSNTRRDDFSDIESESRCGCGANYLERVYFFIGI